MKKQKPDKELHYINAEFLEEVEKWLSWRSGRHLAGVSERSMYGRFTEYAKSKRKMWLNAAFIWASSERIRNLIMSEEKGVPNQTMEFSGNMIKKEC